MQSLCPLPLSLHSNLFQTAKHCMQSLLLRPSQSTPTPTHCCLLVSPAQKSLKMQFFISYTINICAERCVCVCACVLRLPRALFTHIYLHLPCTNLTKQRVEAKKKRVVEMAAARCTGSSSSCSSCAAAAPNGIELVCLISWTRSG